MIVNTCGFLDSAKVESLDAIGEALRENGRVIVTGCLGAEPDYITGAHPTVLAVTGPHQYEQVLDAVHNAVPPSPDQFIDLLPPGGVKLTPRHYSYLKISEGCDHKCKFCIIPDMRGSLQSRPAKAVLREAEKLVEAGVRELLVISLRTHLPMAQTGKGARSSFRFSIYPETCPHWVLGCDCTMSTLTPMCAN